MFDYEKRVIHPIHFFLQKYLLTAFHRLQHNEFLFLCYIFLYDFLHNYLQQP